VPELALNLLSSTLTQTSVKTHYAAVAVPALFAATIYGAAKVGPRLAYVVGSMTIAAMLLLGPLGRGDLTADGHDAGSPARAVPGARRRARQRDERPRRTPLGPSADLQLPGPAGGSLGRRR
jgi:hypothetical protein